MRYLIGIFVILVSLGVVVEGQDTTLQAISESAANTQSPPIQDILSKEQVSATCDDETIAANCAYRAAIEFCGKMILDANPTTDDVVQNDSVVARYNDCVQPYRQRAERSGDLVHRVVDGSR